QIEVGEVRSRRRLERRSVVVAQAEVERQLVVGFDVVLKVTGVLPSEYRTRTAVPSRRGSLNFIGGEVCERGVGHGRETRLERMRLLVPDVDARFHRMPAGIPGDVVDHLVAEIHPIDVLNLAGDDVDA